jgi:chromate transporter
VSRIARLGASLDRSAPSFGEALAFWCKLGWISFGGPAGQISVMHQELVERKRWIGEDAFLHALTYCNLLPGPEAQQLATYCGWRLHGWRGGVAAGALFVLPSIAILWALAWIYVTQGSVPWIAAAFHGLGAAALGVVAFAALRIGRKTLKGAALWAIAAGSFVAIFFLELPFPAIILAAGLIGLLGGRFAPRHFRIASAHGGGAAAAPGTEGCVPPLPERPRRPLWRAAQVIAVCGVLWWTPVLIASAVKGPESTLTQEGLFFSKAAMVTFGGAYAVLPYVADRSVEHYEWLDEQDMTAGLGLAETTPGPLIMVVQFVGFLGGWNHPDGMSPLAAATLGALLTTWVTFLPCFLWIFLGAPYVERLRELRVLSAALTAISAAVVGVILNLAVWFGLRLAFPQGLDAGLGAADGFVLALALGSFVALGWGRVAIHWVVLAGGMLGVARWALA